MEITLHGTVYEGNVDILRDLQEDSNCYYVVVGITGGRYGDILHHPLPPPGMPGRTPLLDSAAIKEALIEADIGVPKPIGLPEMARVPPPGKRTIEPVQTAEQLNRSAHLEETEVFIESGQPSKRAISYRAETPESFVNWTWVLPPHLDFNQEWTGPFDTGHPYVSKVRLSDVT
jgi:hypothetical protein